MLSKRNSDLSQENMVSLSDLPTETIVLILGFLDDKALKRGIALTSTHLWEICNQYFFDTLYGRSLRFNQWQKSELERLRKNLELFKGTHQVTLFRLANRSIQQSVEHYNLSISAFVAFALLASAVPGLLRSIQVLTEVDIHLRDKMVVLFTAFVTIFFFGLVGVGLIEVVVNDTANQNTAFLTSYITEQHLAALHAFFSENKIFLSSHTDQIKIGETSISQLLDFLQQQVVATENLVNSFESHLKSQRTTTKQFLNENDFQKLREINPELPAFAKNAATLWSENNKKKESLIGINGVINESINEDVQHACQARPK